jgi:hypothetical protein
LYVHSLCTADIAIPGRAALYHRLFAKVHNALLPFWSAGLSSGQEQVDCAVLHGSALLWLGIVIPVWLVNGMETRAWTWWQGRAQPAPAGSAHLLLAICTATLSPVACLLAVKGMVYSWFLIAAVWGVEPY